MNDDRQNIREVFPAIKPKPTTVTIVLIDTENGLVDVQTTISGFNPNSNAQALATRLDTFMAEIAHQQNEPAPKLQLVAG